MDVDYYFRDSKIREALSFLRPPVNRVCRDSYKNYLGYVIRDSDNTDKIHFGQNKLSKKISQRAARSSLSLVLQKICKKQIVEDYPISSKTSLLENEADETNTNIKPTIKVTVIPKRDPNCLLKFLDTKKQTTDKNKKDDTPPDKNSIATKNIYLLVAGKKDKIYEITTTDHKTFRDNPKDVRIDKKRFPSKMEKKRKKSLSFEGKVDEQKCSEACFCRSPKEDLGLALEDGYPPVPSRVKIVGRIGRDEDDKYVLKCAATVNGQKVTTKYASEQSIPMMPERKIAGRRDTNFENTPLHISFSDDDLDPISGSTSSQGTQVDRSMQISRIYSTTDRNTQCNLCELCNNTDTSNFDDESKATGLNRSSSPLVIISVYPKPELNTYAIKGTTSANRFDTQNYRTTQLNGSVRVSHFAMNTDLHNARDIFPNKTSVPRCCPCDTALKNDTVKDDTKPESTNIARPNRVSRSPSPVKRSLQSKTKGHKKDFTDTNAVNPKSQSPSPNRSNMYGNMNKRETNVSKQNKKTNATKRADLKKQNDASRPRSSARDKSVNTGVEQPDRLTKKVDNRKRNTNKYKTLTKNEDKPTRRETVLKKSLPTNEISKVSINIDSEREFYDVVFEKGNASTDLKVKRTTKDKFSSQKYFEETYDKQDDDEHVSDSLENFFPVSGSDQHRRSASQAFNKENTELLTTHNMSRLNVRDSLEIGHRRDHAVKYLFERDSDDGNFFAPLKHFPGDNCIIDPIERDREIRELLGIDKKRTGQTGKKHEDDFKLKHKINRNNAIARHYVNQKSVCNSLVEKPVLHLSYSSCTENNQNNNFIHLKRDEEKSITDDEKHNLMKLSTITKVKKQNVKLQNRVNIAVVTKQQSSQYIAQEMLHSRPKDILQPQQRQNAILLSGKQYRKVKKLMHKVNGDWKRGRHIWHSSIVSLGSVKQKRRSECLIHFNKDVQTDSLTKDLERSKSKMTIVRNTEDKHTVVLFRKEPSNEGNDKMRKDIKRVASSIEIRYTSIAYSNVGERTGGYSPIKDIKYGSNLLWKRRDSIETIFRGHKKSFTPNLGTSSLSLLSEEVKSTAESLPTESKPRKPFLRRLMSCLVMRSETTALKVPQLKQKPPQSLDSSVDSYFISTSLGAMDMSSSIYDTTASFYSNHTIGVVNNKIKRGFFNSVREFLSVKKN